MYAIQDGIFIHAHSVYRILTEALITHDFPMSQFEEVNVCTYSVVINDFQLQCVLGVSPRFK